MKKIDTIVWNYILIIITKNIVWGKCKLGINIPLSSSNALKYIIYVNYIDITIRENIIIYAY